MKSSEDKNMLRFLCILILSVTVIAGCGASSEKYEAAKARIVLRYCSLPEAPRHILRTAVENDTVCTAAFVIPSAEAQLFVRGYCATEVIRPAIKDLVKQDICKESDYDEI